MLGCGVLLQKGRKGGALWHARGSMGGGTGAAWIVQARDAPPACTRPLLQPPEPIQGHGDPLDQAGRHELKGRVELAKRRGALLLALEAGGGGGARRGDGGALLLVAPTLDAVAGGWGMRGLREGLRGGTRGLLWEGLQEGCGGGGTRGGRVGSGGAQARRLGGFGPPSPREALQRRPGGATRAGAHSLRERRVAGVLWG